MWRNLLLAAASALIFLGVLEGVLRVSGRVPTNAVRSPDLETLDAIPGLFEPGQEFEDRILPDLSYHVRINSLGFRGAEFPKRKEPGSLRILCLGDSYTFGPYVDDEQALPAVLGRLLSGSRRPGEPPLDVINGGANGFTIADELAFLREKAPAVQPDVVIVAFTQNDILDLARSRPQIEVMRDHARLKSRFAVGPALKLLQRTALFNGMQRFAAWLKVWQRALGAGEAGEGAGGRPELWDQYRALLAETARVLETRDVRFLLVVWPSARQVAGQDPFTPQERLARFAKELDVPALDLAEALRGLEAAGVPAFLVPRDGHPTARGYEAAARAIAARLSELGYLVARDAGAMAPSP